MNATGRRDNGGTVVGAGDIFIRQIRPPGVVKYFEFVHNYAWWPAAPQVTEVHRLTLHSARFC